MRFKYREYGDVMRPVIPVFLSYKDSIIYHEVLIDSGSDRCFFDTEIGDMLGIERLDENDKEAFGIGGKKSSYYSHLVTIIVGDVSYPIEAGFMPSVMGGMASYGLAGQKGFFDKFTVKFNLQKNEIEVNEAKK